MSVCNKNLKSQTKNMAVGISTTIQCASEIEPSFIFVFDQKYDGTYAWLFKTEGNNWNVGLWLKKDKKKLKKLFFEFLNHCASLSILTPPRGAVMSLKKNYSEKLDQQDIEGIYFVGDTCATADEITGEGIRQAILSGIFVAKKINER